MNNLLKNAITSLELGIDDYFSKKENRVFSSVRNLYAGILLMYKSKLLDLCPAGTDEVLIKSKVLPAERDGKIIFIGKGKKTIDVYEIKERFESLNINTNWKVFEKIQNERNDIEHYYAKSGEAVLRGIIVDTFNIVREFIKNELKEDPAELLKKSWKKILNIRDVYYKEKDDCDQEINNLSLDENKKYILKNIFCNVCGSSLMHPFEEHKRFHSTYILDDISMRCSSCLNEVEVSKVFEETVDVLFGSEDYKRIRDGEEPFIKTCPECNRNTFDERESRCYYCDYEKEYYECMRCGVELSLEEQELEGLCSYCNYQLEKLQEDD